MDKDKISELRRVVEATQGVNVALARRKFDATFDPTTVLELLDELGERDAEVVVMDAIERRSLVSTGLAWKKRALTAERERDAAVADLERLRADVERGGLRERAEAAEALLDRVHRSIRRAVARAEKAEATVERVRTLAENAGGTHANRNAAPLISPADAICALANEAWSDEVAPGGFVCAECGMPVESEPCPKHGGTTDD